MLCDTFPQLKDKDDGKYWVSVCHNFMCFVASLFMLYRNQLKTTLTSVLGTCEDPLRKEPLSL